MTPIPNFDPGEDALPVDPGDVFASGTPDHIPASQIASKSDAVREAWLEVAAFAVNSGALADRAAEIVRQLRSAGVLYRVLGKEGDTMLSTLTYVSAVLGDVQAGEIWLTDLGLLDNQRVTAEISKVLNAVVSTTPAQHPEARLGGAITLARSEWSRRKSAHLVKAISSGASPDDLQLAHREVVDAPPTAVDGSTASAENPSAADLLAARPRERDGLVVSSGFPSLDLALTAEDGQPRGICRSGQLAVIVAPSGAGKTSALSSIVPAGILDVINQKHRGRCLYVHNEDETAALFEAMGMGPGGRFSRIADQVAYLKTTSREEFIKFFYLEVLRAKRLGVETGLPTSVFLPPMVYLDYYQALSSPRDANEVAGTTMTANLMLYGIANMDPVACATFSGVAFQEFTGEAWPDDIGGFTCGVLCTAQLLLKGAGALTPYDPNARMDWRDYASADGQDQPAWQPRPGDAPLSKLESIRGSTVLTQNASTIIGLHRCRPRNNPEAGVNAAGYRTLADTRAYFTILKARHGQRMYVVPAEFNLQRSGGKRAQYFDAAAEAALSSPETAFPHDREVFQQSGDPILPIRASRSLMAGIRY